MAAVVSRASALRAASGAAAALLLTTTLAPAACARRDAKRPNVLLVTLDTLRADRIGTYGHAAARTPALDRLAREGIRFDDATSQSPLTGPAHTALLTGVYPTRLGIRINAAAALPEPAVTLAESLKAAGYRTGAFIGAFVLDRQYGFAQGFDVFDAAFPAYRGGTKLQAERAGGDVAAAAVSWLRGLPRDAPFFAWVHLYDAHTPYAAPEPYASALADPYDGEVAYVDAVVGSLIAALEASGTLDSTIVAAVGDHGESLGEHGEDEHGVFLYEGVLRIPWILRLPERERAGAIVAEQVRSIDLMPTVLELAGVAAHAGMDGESVASVGRGAGRRDPPASYADAHYPRLHFGWSLLRSLRIGEWKYIDAPRPELYDLRAGRAERENVIAARGSIAAGMAADVERLWRGFGDAAETPSPQPDLETLARLRSLGYVGIAAPTPRGAAGGEAGADPKDKIRELGEFRALLSGALADLDAKRADAALAKLRRAVAINARAYDVHVMLGDAWLQKGNRPNAIGEYDAASLLNPEIAAPHLLAAEAHRAAGEHEKAMARVDRAAAIEPGSGEVAFVRGRILESGGRLAEALEAYRRAVALNPADTAARGRYVGVAMTLRRFDAAEPELKVLLAAGYQPARTHYALGVIAEARGDRASAAAAYRRALQADPSLQQARVALARVGGL